MSENRIQELNQEYLKNFIKSKVPINAYEDINQEVILVLIEKLKKDNTIKNIHSYSFQIARNKIADYYSKMERMIHVESQFAAVVNKDFEPCVCDILETIIQRILPEKFSEAFLLSDIYKIPQKEISEKLGLSYENTKSRIQRARKMFKDEVQKFGEIIYNKKGQFVSFKLKSTKNLEPELSELLKNLKLID